MSIDSGTELALRSPWSGQWTRLKLPAEADGVPYDAIAAGVVGLRISVVNVFAVAGESGWTLIDAGLNGSAGRLKSWAAEHFGDAAPDGIVLTHAHFDHVGAIDAWNVPVYAHVEELPYVTGERLYPPPDPTVGGGLMARMARLTLGNLSIWGTAPGHSPRTGRSRACRDGAGSIRLATPPGTFRCFATPTAR